MQWMSNIHIRVRCARRPSDPGLRYRVAESTAMRGHAPSSIPLSATLVPPAARLPRDEDSMKIIVIGGDALYFTAETIATTYCLTSHVAVEVLSPYAMSSTGYGFEQVMIGSCPVATEAVRDSSPIPAGIGMIERTG